MSMLLPILAFLAIGGLVGFLGTRLFEGTSMAVSLLLGVLGSFGASWIAKLLGLGAGFLAFSLWGVVFGIIGACLLVAIYGLIARRRVTT